MSSIFERFGAKPEPDARPAAAGELAPVEQALPGPPDVPVALDTPDEKAKPAAAPEILPGVPLWLHGLDRGDVNIYWLAALDPDATHEAGQNARHAGFDGDKQIPSAGDPVPKSGGSAYYYSVVTGKGFSVPIAPEGA